MMAAIAAVGLCGLVTVPVAAQQPSGVAVVLGTITDTTGAPIAEADVLVLGTTIAWRTDARGAFAGTLRPGSHMLRVRRMGYEARSARLDIIGTDTATVFFALAPMAVELAPVLVEAMERKYTAKMTGFAERMNTQGAPASSFITREEIERENPMRVSDLLRKRSARAQQCANGSIYVDGILWEPMTVRARRDPTRMATDEFPVSDIEAIEVYSGAGQIPMQYNRTQASGKPPGCVVLIWTR
jgi:hypothetical protein